MIRPTTGFLSTSPVLSQHRSSIVLNFNLSYCSFAQPSSISAFSTRLIKPVQHYKSKPSRSNSIVATLTMPDYTLYYAATPNGKKIALCLEDMGLSYKIEPVSITKNEQFSPEFKAINPNSKIPALVDHTNNDLAIFESGAILEYLAEKTKLFMPADIEGKYAVKQWLYWQMAGFGPMLGQVGFFWKFSKDDVPVAKERYLKEATRLYGVLDEQLSKNKYMAGDEYSIADMATYFWSKSLDFYGITDHFKDIKNVQRWQEDIEKRPSVTKVNEIPFNW